MRPIDGADADCHRARFPAVGDDSGEKSSAGPRARPLTHRPACKAIFGSSFPIGTFAALAGLFVALILHEMFIFIEIARVLPIPGRLYLAVTLIAGVGANILWIGGYG